MRGTVSVVYDIPGFRDSVVDGRKTGVLTKPTPAALAAEGVRRCLSEPELYERLRRSARDSAATLDWERTADAFESAIGARA